MEAVTVVFVLLVVWIVVITVVVHLLSIVIGIVFVFVVLIEIGLVIITVHNRFGGSRIDGRMGVCEHIPRVVELIRLCFLNQQHDHSKRDSHRRADVPGFDFSVDLALHLFAGLSFQRRTRKQISEKINVPRNSVQPSMVVSLCVTRSIIFVFFMTSIRRLSIVFSTELFA